MRSLAFAPAGSQAADGAPDPAQWEVIGVSGGATVNLRKGPSTGEAVVAELARGTVLQNLGCSGEGPDRWCQIALGAGGVSGWAAARYLAPHVAQADPVAGADAPASVAPDPAAGSDAAASAATGPAKGDVEAPTLAGTVACGLRGQSVQSCEAMKRESTSGGVEIIVTFADGFERILDFGDGADEVYSPDPTDEVDATRAEGKTVVEINGVERIEVPDALIGR